MAYPTSVSTDADLYLTKNQLSTVLNGSIDNVVTTVTVTSTTGFPTVGVITIDSEVIKYTSTNATQFLGCTRGFDGTSATSHSGTVPVKHAVTAVHHNILKDELIAIETDIINNLRANLSNLLYNGGMEVHQFRAGLASNFVNGDYFIDGWKFNKNSNRQMNGGYETGAGNFSEGVASLKLESLTGNTVEDYAFQSVENFARLANRPVAFSIRLKCNTASVVRAFISFSGPGGTTVYSSFHTGGNTFETLTVSTTIGSAPGSVNFGVAVAGASVTYADAAIAVIGTAIPTFIPDDPQNELARCQRYWEQETSNQTMWARGSQDGSLYSISSIINFNTAKRIAPSMNITWTFVREDPTGTDNQAAYTKVAEASSPQGFTARAYKNVAGNPPSAISFTWTADARM